MPDNFAAYQNSLDAPADGAFAITPGASDLAIFTRAIYIGGAGNVKLTTVGGTEVTFTAVPVGTILPVRAKKVSADSTATLMIGLY